MNDPHSGAQRQESTQRESLRTALELNRVMAFLEKERINGKGTAEHHDAKRRPHLEALLPRAHRELNRKWQGQTDIPPGEFRNAPGIGKAVRDIIGHTLCVNGDSGERQPKKLFDSNGIGIYHPPKVLAEILADFYQKMRAVKPFEYGNETALDVFMYAMMDIPAVKAVCPHGIDLRRLTSKEWKALHDDASDHKTLRRIFEHALNPRLTPALHNPANGFGSWEKHSEDVAGIPFLSYEMKDGTTCLVTINGGLVPLEKIRPWLEKQLKAPTLIATVPPITEDQIAGYVPGTESLRIGEREETKEKYDRTEVDGIPATKQAAPLFCLDQNILTGLRENAHEELMGMMKNLGKTSPFDLGNNPELKASLERAAQSDRQRDIIEVAYTRNSAITNKMNKLKEGIFKDKTPVADPHLFVSMGGAGCGKASVKEVAHAYCGNNFVNASLDEFRTTSDLYTLLVAARHHADDYSAVEPFANALRTWVADTAMGKNDQNNKYNLLWDGTGVEWERYAKIVKECKDRGFRSHVVDVDIPIDKAPERVLERFPKENRALPWIVVIGKHVGTPKSYSSAAEDKNVDKISSFANDRGIGEHHLVSEGFILSDQELKILQDRQQNGGLAEHFHSMIQNHPDSLLRRLAMNERQEVSAEKLEALIKRIPHFTDANTSFIVELAPDKNRVLAIYDTARHIEFEKKGLKNPQASHVDRLDDPVLPILAGRNERWRDQLRNRLVGARAAIGL